MCGSTEEGKKVKSVSHQHHLYSTLGIKSILVRRSQHRLKCSTVRPSKTLQCIQAVHKYVI